MARKKPALRCVEVQSEDLAKVLFHATYRITNVAIEEGGCSIVDALVIPNRGEPNANGTFVQLPCETEELFALMSRAGTGRSKAAKNGKPTVSSPPQPALAKAGSVATDAKNKKKPKRRQRNPITQELDDPGVVAKIKAEIKRHGPTWLPVQQERHKEGLAVFPEQ